MATGASAPLAPSRSRSNSPPPSDIEDASGPPPVVEEDAAGPPLIPVAADPDIGLAAVLAPPSPVLAPPAPAPSELAQVLAALTEQGQLLARI